MEKTCFLVLGLFLNCLGNDIAVPPQADHVLPAWGSINGPADVDRLFAPGQDTPKAIWSEKGYVVLPVNFSKARHARVTWDVKISIDLLTAKGVQFDFFCKDIAPFSWYKHHRTPV